MSEPLMHVNFEEETGKILAISPKKQGKNSISVPISSVQNIIDGKTKVKNYRVQYNPKKKQLELANLHKEAVDGFVISDFIYEIPEVASPQQADISVQQDIPNTCWKFKIGSYLQRNLRKNNIRLNSTLKFSVTAKHDPNLLYKLLEVDFSNVLKNNCVVLDFTMSFEYNNNPISVFAARKFDTYEFIRIFDE